MLDEEDLELGQVIELLTCGLDLGVPQIKSRVNAFNVLAPRFWKGIFD